MSPAAALGGALALGYVSGSLPWGLWLGRLLRGVDVRTLGSGNLGATNVYRALGPGIGVPVLLLDIAKGAIPVSIVKATTLGAAFPGGPEWAAISTALAAVAGHVWTCFAGFRGGKGVATTVGVLLALSPVAFGVFLAVFIVTLLATRYVSLGSMLGSVAFAVTLAVHGRRGAGGPLVAFGVVLAVLVILRHRENIGRLRAGTERRFSFGGGGGKP